MTTRTGLLWITCIIRIRMIMMIRIDVTPTNPVAPKGATQQFGAFGVFNNGSFQDLTDSSVWSSSKPSIATISTTGLASALLDGITTIKAVNGLEISKPEKDRIFAGNARELLRLN